MSKTETAPLRVIEGVWGYACVHADAVFIPAVMASTDFPLRRVLADIFADTGCDRMIFSAVLNPDDLRPRLRNIVREWDEYVEYMDEYSHCIEIRYEVPMRDDMDGGALVQPEAGQPGKSKSTNGGMESPAEPRG